MFDYSCYFAKTPTIVINLPGRVTIENKNKNSLNLEIDYNSFDKDTLTKIKINKEQQFYLATLCSTYKEGEEEIAMYIKHIDENGKYKWLNILSENNIMNFSMIKNKVEIFKNDILVETIYSDYSKTINFSLPDGDYIFRFIIRTLDDEEIYTNDIQVEMKTNYYSMSSTKTDEIKIPFNEKEGNFNLILAANSKRLYSFKVVDISSDNDNIFEFSYYNSNGNSKKEVGKIGAELNLLNDKQIEEIIKYPEQETLIKPEFVFDINELFTTQHSEADIGVIRFPTIREKIRDTYLPYYNLKCDVSQDYSVDFDKTDDLLVTDKFKNYPLFYKFFVDTPFETIKIIDSDDNEITDFIVEDISDEVHIVYFNPLRNKEYYYILDNDPPLLIRYKRSIDSYKMIFSETNMTYNNNKLEFEYPNYIGDLMLKGNDTYEVEIQFDDYTRKIFTMKAVDKEFKFLEDERVKINRKVISLEVKTKDKVSVISMVCNFKNNRTNYSFFKSNFKDFVYIANPVGEININDIPENELSKFNINKKYILKDGLIEEVQNGPLYLEDINKTDIVFTDIEEWLKEHSIGETEFIRTSPKDKFFIENVVNPLRVIKHED